MVSVREKFVSLLSALFAIYITAIDASLEEIERHLKIGKQFLVKGQFSDALTHYHSALDADPDKYESLHGRATCYLAMGKSKSALADLNRILEIKPDFLSVRMQRANILLKQGDLDGGMIDYEFIISKGANEEATQKLSIIEPTRQAIAAAKSLFDRGDFIAAEPYFTAAIETCPNLAELHEKRAACYEATGQYHKAIGDLRAVTKLVADSTDILYKIAQSYYDLGDTEQSLTQVRECLRLDQDHKKCHPLYKKVRSVVKEHDKISSAVQNDQWEDCLLAVKRILKTEAKIQPVVMHAKERACFCLSKGGNAQEAIETCTEVHSYEPNNVDVLCNRADAYINNEQLEEAQQDFQTALNKNEDNRRAKEGLEKTQKLIKRRDKRDYYKILEVPRNANKKQIMKQYRKLAQKWHPDNFPDEKDKKAAEKKFIEVAAAKEVLTDPDKRNRFDNGEDPLDPEAQQHGHHGFNPFQGFDGFGGGPFNFKFHFQ